MKMKTICIATLLIFLTGCTSDPPVKEQTDEGKIENSDQENENAEPEKRRNQLKRKHQLQRK